MIVDRLPTPAEHKALMDAVGWSDHIDDEVLAASLAGSTSGVVAVVDGAVVGMARIVGDGAHYFYVQDVVVHPDHEGSGLATDLVRRLLESVPPGAFVGLFASDEAIGVYDELGFVTKGSTGMHLAP